MRHAPVCLWMRRAAVSALIGGMAAAGVVPVRGQQPPLRLPGLAGGALSEADLARGNNVLVFFAGWSPRCRDVVDRANALSADLGRSARVALIDFQESPADVRSFLRDKSPKTPVYLDEEGAFSKKHSVTVLPYVLVFRDGEVRARGSLDDRAGSLVRDALR